MINAIVSSALALLQGPNIGLTEEQVAEATGKSLGSFVMKSIEGKPVELKQYVGKVVVIVNVASKCGLTPQYESLQKLYSSHKDKGVVVLGFPANEFRNQEPGSNAEIAEFCSKNYGVTFPMFEKIVVKGEGIHPLYQWLLASTDPKVDIDWNFAKFIVDRDGKTVRRFSSRLKPDSDEFLAAVRRSL